MTLFLLSALAGLWLANTYLKGEVVPGRKLGGCLFALLLSALLFPIVGSLPKSYSTYVELVTPYVKLVLLGLIFGGVLRLWFSGRDTAVSVDRASSAATPAIAVNPSAAAALPGTDEKPNDRDGVHLLARDFPWILITGALFFLGLLSAPDLPFMQQLKSVKAGSLELEFKERLQNGKAERFQVKRLTTPLDITSLVKQYSDTRLFDEALLDNNSYNGNRSPWYSNGESIALLRSATFTHDFYKEVLLPIFQCGASIAAKDGHSDIGSSATTEQLVAALGPLPNRLRDFLDLSELLYSPALLDGKIDMPPVDLRNANTRQPDPEAIIEAYRRLVEAAWQARWAMYALAASPAPSSRMPAPKPEEQPCSFDYPESAPDIWWKHQLSRDRLYRLAQVPYLYRTTAYLYMYAGKLDIVIRGIPQSLLERFSWDPRLPSALATAYANLPQPDLPSATRWAEESMHRADVLERTLKQKGEQLKTLTRAHNLSRNNLAFYLAEMGHDTERAVDLATQAHDADSGDADYQDTLAYAKLVDGVRNPKWTLNERKSAVDSAIRMFEDGVGRSKQNSTLGQEQWFRLHLSQARELREAMGDQ